MMQEKVHLTEEKETLLITLYSKAMDNGQETPLLGDKVAEDVVRRIDYDFRKLKISTGDQFALVIRAKQLDVWAAEFLADHPDAILLHLGCGLDSRVLRMSLPSTVRWFDLDFPEVIELRRRFYSERDGYCMIGSSVMDPRWLKAISADHPVMVIAEGLLPYLSEKDVKELLDRLTDRFPGGQLAFDALSRLAKRVGRYKSPLRATGASIDWAIGAPAEIEKLNPRLELIAESSIVGSPYVAGMPWSFRMMCRAMNGIPVTRNLMRLLRYQF